MRPLLADPAIQMALHAGLALLFARAAWHKLRGLGRFGAALNGYRMLPAAGVPVAAASIAAAEAAVAVGLALPATGSAAALAGAGLLLCYASAMAVAWLRGQREIDCGCGPPDVRRRIGPELIARNGVLAGLCIAATLAPGARELLWIDHLSIVAALLAAAALYAFSEYPAVRRQVA